MRKQHSYIEKVQAMAKKSSPKPQEIARFLRGSTVDSVVYDSKSDTLTITFHNAEKAMVVRTQTSSVSDITEDGSWVEQKPGPVEAGSLHSTVSFLNRISVKARRDA